ncbi:glomulin-like [Tropilaelaps mercedesae]|uniref:Glomulin-like n=1 Tax=Tropilaelaps mercedesae TaxID=418985 RepID=A0A1V9X1F2_9ACAR|nr:glomulin-like [Tropilaelaps mercedesae]
MEGDNGNSAVNNDTEVEWDTTFIQALGDHRFADALGILLQQDANLIRPKCWDLITFFFFSRDEYEQLQAERLEDYQQDDIPTVSNEIVDEQIIDDLLSNLTQHMTAKELLMVYLEIVTRIKSSSLFAQIVTSVTENLQTTPKFNKVRVIWSLEVIAGTLRELAPPSDSQLETAEERMLMDATKEVRIINDRYRVLVRFLETNLGFIRKQHPDAFNNTDRLQICSHTMKNLGSTLGLLDLSPPPAGKSPSTQYTLAIRLGRILNSFVDPIGALYLSQCMRTKNSDDELVVGSISGAVFCYMVFCLSENFPRLYSPVVLAYLLQTFSLFLITSAKSMHILKGLCLIKVALPYMGSTVEEDDICMVRRLLRTLLQVMTSCSLKEARDSAMVCWKELFSRCPLDFRVDILISIFRSLEQPSVRGFLIDELRKVLRTCNNSVECHEIVKNVVFLPDGETTDLLDHSEHILSALNLLRYALRLKLVAKTPHLDKYIDDLKKGLELSRAHYELQLGIPEDNWAKRSSLWPNIPRDMEKHVLSESINRLNLIEFVLGVVQSLYDSR